VKSFLEKMEISKYFFGKKHGKLAHGRNLSPKVFPDDHSLILVQGDPTRRWIGTRVHKDNP
jgi:hypothetical protein